MKVIWDPLARQSMRQIARYIQVRFGSMARKAFVQNVKDAESLVMRSPNIGLVDPLFAGRKRPYRSIVINGQSKMVYFVGDDAIYIAAFWDTRREPKQQAQQTNDNIES